MKTRILTVTTDFWTAQSRWVFRYGKWECVITDKELGFLKGLSPEQARLELLGLGAKWQWTQVEDQSPSTIV